MEACPDAGWLGIGGSDGGEGRHGSARQRGVGRSRALQCCALRWDGGLAQETSQDGQLSDEEGSELERGTLEGQLRRTAHWAACQETTEFPPGQRAQKKSIQGRARIRMS